MALILDTGPLFAFYDRRDHDHLSCRTLVEERTEQLIIPVPVLLEADQLGSARIGPQFSVTLLQEIARGVYTIADLLHQDYERVHDLMQRYADSDIGFVDAAVLAVVERLREPKLATLDHRHFGTMRPLHVEALQLLPT